MLTIDKLKQVIGDYLQDKPEPYLVIQTNSVTAEALDWMKQVSFSKKNEFWVISKEKAEEAIKPFDWNKHWEKESERTLQKVEDKIKK